MLGCFSIDSGATVLTHPPGQTRPRPRPAEPHAGADPHRAAAHRPFGRLRGRARAGRAGLAPRARWRHQRAKGGGAFGGPGFIGVAPGADGRLGLTAVAPALACSLPEARGALPKHPGTRPPAGPRGHGQRRRDSPHAGQERQRRPEAGAFGFCCVRPGFHSADHPTFSGVAWLCILL